MGRTRGLNTGLLAMDSVAVERACARSTKRRLATQWLDSELPNPCKHPNLGLHPIQLHRFDSIEASGSLALAPVIPVPPPLSGRRVYSTHASCSATRDPLPRPGGLRWTSVGPLVRRPVAVSHHTSRVASASGRPNYASGRTNHVCLRAAERELVAVGCASANIRCECVV